MLPLELWPEQELHETLNQICNAIETGRLRFHDLLYALDLGDAIVNELRQRRGEPAQRSVEVLTWSPTALSDAEAAINEYCREHGMTYQQFRARVDRWLEQQDKPRAMGVESVADRLRKLVRNKDLRT